MSYYVKEDITMTGTTETTLTVQSKGFTGELSYLLYTPGTGPLTSTSTILITAESTAYVVFGPLVQLTTTPIMWFPRVQVNGTTGNGLTYGTTGEEIVAVRPPLAGERLLITVTHGTTTHDGLSGVLTAVVEGAQP